MYENWDIFHDPIPPFTTAYKKTPLSPHDAEKGELINKAFFISYQ